LLLTWGDEEQALAHLEKKSHPSRPGLPSQMPNFKGTLVSAEKTLVNGDGRLPQHRS
jgi:hypothetical protein